MQLTHERPDPPIWWNCMLSSHLARYHKGFADNWPPFLKPCNAYQCHVLKRDTYLPCDFLFFNRVDLRAPNEIQGVPWIRKVKLDHIFALIAVKRFFLRNSMAI